MGAEDTPKRQASSTSCPLPYPDRFHAASKFVKLTPAGAKKLSQEVQLALYALQQQALIGPCTTSKPWGWNVVESTKWQSWKQLGDMNTMEAMRLYVRTVDEEQPDWYLLLLEEETKPADSAAAPGDKSAEAAVSAATDAANGQAQPGAQQRHANGDTRPAVEYAQEGAWLQLPAETSQKPLPRYEQAAGLVGGSHMYIVGGNYAGRYLNDVWRFDVNTLQWFPVTLRPRDLPAAAAKPADADMAPADDQQQQQAAAPAPAVNPLPPLAGHTIITWKDKLIVLGGHVKAKDNVASMPLRIIDTSTGVVATVAIDGPAPLPRGGHTATLIGTKIYVFGGEDAGRRALGDLWVLDLDTLSWACPSTQGKAPPARSAHSAAAYQGRYLVIFGGGSVATCYNDVYVLDTVTMEWSKPRVTGAKVTPRAGHCGAVVDGIWYIIGGGNNVKGCTDLVALDLRPLSSSSNDGSSLTWHVVASIQLRDPLSSEGISLVCIEREKLLLAFGGYNGKYQNTISTFKVASLPPAAAQEGGKDQAAAAGAAPAPTGDAGKPAAKPAAPAGAAAAAAVPKPGTPKAAAAPAADPLVELRSQLELARQEADIAIRESAAAKEASAQELAMLRKQLTAASAAQQEAQKLLEESKAALAKESTKVLKLEAEIAELQKQLSVAAELQKEVEAYRRAAKEAESRKGSGGLWGYIAGTSGSS